MSIIERRGVTNEGYILEWLDNLITVALNPGKANIVFIQADDVTNIQRHIVNGKNKIMMTIRLFVFDLFVFSF